MSERRTHLSFFNSPQFFFGLFGHSGLVIEHLDRTCHLYSFHPAPNDGEPVGPGSIAQIVNPADARDIEAFMRACMTDHAESRHRHRRGIQLANGTKVWYERIRRIIRMEVGVDQADAVEQFARSVAADPPRFNILTYSCEHFVDDALAAGGIELYGKKRSLAHTLIPNYVYHEATDRTVGITGFQKIDFTQRIAPAAQPSPA